MKKVIKDPKDEKIIELEKRITKIEKYLIYQAFGPPHGTDPAYYESLEFIKGKEYISFNQLQKFLEIGYARVGAILDLLEKNKKIGPKENRKERRKIIG